MKYYRDHYDPEVIPPRIYFSFRGNSTNLLETDYQQRKFPVR